MAGTGGARPGAGRKSKKDEEKLVNTIQKALKKYGGEEKLWENIAKNAVGGKSGDKELLINYLYGKPLQRIKGSIETTGENVIKVIYENLNGK